MLLRLNSLCALMLILSLTVNCEQTLDKNARDFQRDVSVDGNNNHEVSAKGKNGQQYEGNENARMVGGDTKANMLINFKMHQLKSPKNLKRRRRLINMTNILNPSGRSYLGNLAAATNDAYLKMQNYAATFLVVVTTPKSSEKKFESLPAVGNSLIAAKKKVRGYPGRYRSIQGGNSLNNNRILHEHHYRAANTFKPKRILPTPTTKPTEKIDKDTEDPLLMADSFASRSKRGHKQKKHQSIAEFIKTSSKQPDLSVIDNIDELLKVVHVKEPKSSEPNLAAMSFEITTDSKKSSRATQQASSVTQLVSTTKQQQQKPTVKFLSTTEAKLVSKKPNPYDWENQLMHEVNIKVREDKTCPDGCDKIYQNEPSIFNETAPGDCNLEKNDDGGNKGGYDIPSKEDLEEQKSKCPEEDTCGSSLHETTSPSGGVSENEGCSGEAAHKCNLKPSKCGGNSGKTTTPSPNQKTCESNDDDDVESECGDGESDTKLPHQHKCSENKEDKKVKKIKPKSRGKRQLLSDGQPSTPHYTLFKLASIAPGNSQILSQAQLAQAHIDIPRSLEAAHLLTSLPSLNLAATTLPTEHLIKKSIDRNSLPSLIENLKVVDQKLAEAVEPLHCAQETLDNLSKAECTTQASCGNNNAGTSDNVLGDISDAERAALQKLAYKIINCGGGGKLKRSNVKSTPSTTADFLGSDGIIAKRGVGFLGNRVDKRMSNNEVIEEARRVLSKEKAEEISSKAAMDDATNEVLRMSINDAIEEGKKISSNQDYVKPILINGATRTPTNSGAINEATSMNEATRMLNNEETTMYTNEAIKLSNNEAAKLSNNEGSTISSDEAMNGGTNLSINEPSKISGNEAINEGTRMFSNDVTKLSSNEPIEEGRTLSNNEPKKISIRSANVDSTTELSSTTDSNKSSPSKNPSPTTKPASDKAVRQVTSSISKRASDKPVRQIASSIPTMPTALSSINTQSTTIKAPLGAQFRVKVAEDYDYENSESREERLNRLQRDLNVANELEEILKQIRLDKPRGKRHLPNHHRIEEHLYKNHRSNDQIKTVTDKSAHNHVGTNDHSSNHNNDHSLKHGGEHSLNNNGEHTKNNPDHSTGNKDDGEELMEDNRSLLRPRLKKKKKKTFWRKLFGKRSADVDERFLNNISKFQF